MENGRRGLTLGGSVGHGTAHVAELLVDGVTLELVKVNDTDDLGDKVEHDGGGEAVDDGQHQNEPRGKWLIGCVEDKHNRDDHSAEEEDVEQREGVDSLFRVADRNLADQETEKKSEENEDSLISDKDKEKDDATRRASESTCGADVVLVAINLFDAGGRSGDQSPQEEQEDGRSKEEGRVNEMFDRWTDIDFDRRSRRSPNAQHTGHVR